MQTVCMYGIPYVIVYVGSSAVYRNFNVLSVCSMIPPFRIIFVSHHTRFHAYDFCRADVGL